MKRLLAIFCAICLILALAACGNTTKETTIAEEKTTAGATTAVTTQAPAAGAINVPAPAGWTAKAGALSIAQYTKNTSSFLVKTENSLAGKTLDAVAEEAKAVISTSFKNVQYEGGNEKITVAGKDAVKFTWTGVVASMDFKYVYVYVPVGNDVYSFVFGDLAKSFDNGVGPEIDAILASVTFG